MNTAFIQNELVELESDVASPAVLNALLQFPLACRIVDKDLNVLWQSPRLVELIGNKSGDVCCASLGLLHSDADCPSRRTVVLGVAQKRTRWLGRICLAVETVPVRNGVGEIVASFEFYRDVTAERKLEASLIRQQELLETINRSMIEINHHLEDAQAELEDKNRSLEIANDQLRSLDQLKDDFLSIVSHELKAPLTSIKASVNLIAGSDAANLSQTGRELLDVCQRSTDRLHRLVEDLLDIARIESGRMTLGFSRFSAAEMVRECFQSVKTLADQKNLSLIGRIPDDLIISADHDRVIQVIVNLVNNAIKFTDRGHITVEVEQQFDQVVFRVRDTGPGISPDDQARIFDKFTQVGSALQRNTGGTGLGLSIARGIVREHGGDITVSSTPGDGSTFIFVIPQPPGKDTHESPRPLD